jgi:DNA invertase Pin-like site-specific DNA recombinase
MKRNAATAYSYIRFSTPEQSKGDSLRRQTESAADWCIRSGIKLDTSTTFRDLGKSAFLGDHRSNPERHRLAVFLKMVQDGAIPRGSYLILENLDRLSREHIQPALLLSLNLLQAGIRIVQLKPSEMVFDEKSDTLQVMMMMMELARGHGESAIKSERVGKAWAQKKELARQGKAQSGRGPVAGMTCMTHKLPAWIEERGGTLHPIPARAALVRRIFHLSAAGYSASSIVKLFRDENVPPMGRSDQWLRSYVAQILADRRPLGEYQPRNRDEKADGEPIKNYFPAVINEKEWNAARAVSSSRGLPPTRITGRVNLFAGLLKDARNGRRGYHRVAGGKKRAYDILVNDTYKEGLAPAISFPVHVFEAAVLQLLAEIDPLEVIGRIAEPDESAALTGEIATVEAKIADLEAALLEGESIGVAKVLRAQEAKLTDLKAKLAEASRKAAHPLAVSWSEAQTLVDVLENSEDVTDTRLRIRAALRRIVESIWLLIVPRGVQRLAAVQMRFVGGGRRDYLIHYRFGKGNTNSSIPASWDVRSVKWPAKGKGKGKGHEVDLREKRHVAELQALMEKIDLETLKTLP